MVKNAQLNELLTKASSPDQVLVKLHAMKWHVLFNPMVKTNPPTEADDFSALSAKEGDLAEFPQTLKMGDLPDEDALSLNIAVRRTWAACKQATAPSPSKKKDASTKSPDSDSIDDEEDPNERRGFLDDLSPFNPSVKSSQ